MERNLIFIVGPNETKIPAHIAIVAARSQFLKSKILVAKESRNQHFEKLIGAIEVQLSTELPQLEVKLPSIQPEAFEMALYYIYTDNIDFKDPLQYLEFAIHCSIWIHCSIPLHAVFGV